MEEAKTTVSTVYSKLNSLHNSKQLDYTVVEVQRILATLSDVVPDDGYTGFYVNRLKELGVDRFILLANKARRGSDKPARLFAWMLKHNEQVR